MFHKNKDHIPLLDAIKQISYYVEFFKDLCTYKKKLVGNERINVSYILERNCHPTAKIKVIKRG